MASSNTASQIADETELMKEICRLRLIKTNLSARYFKLKSKLYIPRPLSFKEYEERVPQRRPVHTDSVEAFNLNLLARVYRMCGVQFTEANKNFFRADLTVMCGDLYHEGFFVEIKKIENDFHVGAYHMPIAIDMKEIEKLTPLKTYEDITVFLKFLHRCLRAYFHREKQVKEFKNLCATYNIHSEVFATHNMKYLEFTVPANDLIVSDAKSLVSFCFVYDMNSLIPTNGSFVQKDMTEDDERALFDCVELFMREYLPIALVNLMNEKNMKKEVLSSSGTRRSEEPLNPQTIKPTEEMRLSASKQISIHEEDKEKSSYSIDVSSITTSEVGKTEKPVKKSERDHKSHPIAESTPFGLSCKEKNEIGIVSVKKGQQTCRQTSMRKFLPGRNMLEEMTLEENTTFLPRRSNRNKSNLSHTENKTKVSNVTNAVETKSRRVREVLSNSYEETPPVRFSKGKFKRNK